MCPLSRSKQEQTHRTITLETLFRERLSTLEITPITVRRSFSTESIRPYVKLCRRKPRPGTRAGSILVLSPAVKDQWLAMSVQDFRRSMRQLADSKAALMIFARCADLPSSFIGQLCRTQLPAAMSPLHENLLESRIQALIRERIHHRITLHGVALVIRGRGVLITGGSGIGKTTAALESVYAGGVWIADDVAVIKRDSSGRLVISGQPRIRHLLHTRKTGIIPVGRLLKAPQIKLQARLDVIIDVVRTAGRRISFRYVKQHLLETVLPGVRIHLPRTGYLDKNLLEKAARRFERTDH